MRSVTKPNSDPDVQLLGGTSEKQNIAKQNMAEASAVGMHKYWPWAIGEPGTKVFEAVPTKERPEPSQVGQTLPTDSEFYTDHELKKKGPDGKTVWIPYLCEDSAGQLFQGWVKKRGCKGRSGPRRCTAR